MEVLVRAVRYHEYGGPEVLRIEDVPAPAPGPGQASIQVEAIGANAVDTQFRAGTAVRPWALPATVTGDVVGRIVALGPDAPAGIAVGDRVAGLAEDAHVEQALVDARWLAPVPEEADAAEATALSMILPLALRLLRFGRLAEGETVLIQSAAGAIGHLAVQVAAHLGAARIIGTASTPDKRDFVRSLGAQHAIDSTDPDWPAAVRAAAPGGVDGVLDGVGGETFDHGLDLLAPLGRMVAYGAMGGALSTVPVAALLTGKQVAGFSIRAFQAARPAEAAQDIADAVDLWRSGAVRSVVHARYALEDVAKAHEEIEARGNRGRIVLIP
jgi:NADPH:quinone reductase